MLARVFALALLASCLGYAPTARAAWMWTGWEEASGTQEQCLQTAAAKLRDLGFSVTVNPQTTFGWRGQDGVSVRCIAERRLAVIFVYAATASEEGRVILEQVREAFKAPAGGAAPARPPGSGGSKF